MIKLVRIGARARLSGAALALTLTVVGVAASTPVTMRPPAWAYPLPAPSAHAPPAKGATFHLPGTTALVTSKEVDALFVAADWRPGDHPPLPAIVARGRRPDVFACGVCHLADGQGKPENASLAGLRALYIIEQVGEFRSGRRRPAVSGLFPQAMMTHVATHVRPGELAAAARYFAGLAYRPWIQVVESRAVPRTRVSAISTYEPIPGAGSEPLGQRIIEMPRWPAKRAPNDHPIGFTAYVPMGAIARGRTLASLDGGRAMPCAACHGARLEGTVEAPRLAGRSPTYLARQLFDIRAGDRRGPAVALMAPITVKLSNTDVIDLAAYLASRRP